MWLSDDEKEMMTSIIITMIYNTKEDLRTKIINFKPLLRKEVYELLINGDEYVYKDNREVFKDATILSCYSNKKNYT